MSFILAQFLTGFANAAALFMVASGLSLIFGVTRIVNFAHGSLYMLGAYVAYSAMQILHGALGFWASVLIAGLIVGLVGAAIEMAILRRVYKAPELFQLVATFGVILMAQDATLLIWGAEDLLGPQAPGLTGVVEIFGERVPKYDLALIALSPLVLAGLWFLFNRTRVGILVRAATEDREMVAALGVNQSWLFTGVFFLGAVLAGVGGAVQLPKGGANLLMDFNILAAVFVVVVIGGMGSMLGAFIAALLISELGVFGVQLLPQSTLVLMFVVMAVVLMIRPWGLLGLPEQAGQHGQAGPAEQPTAPLPPRGRLLFAVAFGALAALPLAGDQFLLVLMSDVLIFALFAASLHFMMGPGGLVSFGHAAFYGSGAYAAALAVHYAGTPMELALILAPVAAGAMALAVGWLCVRLSGVYFAMLTLAIAQVLWSIVFQWGAVTGGDDGMLGIWPSRWASGAVVYYYLVLILASLAIASLRYILHTPFGYAMRGARDSALRSESIGIHVKLVQWLAFAVAGAFAGLAGGLFVFAKGSIFPTEMEIATSFDALIMVLLGGVKTLSGPLAGAAGFTLLQDWLARFEYWRFALGLMIVALVIVFPEGIAGFARRRFGRLIGLKGEA